MAQRTNNPTSRQPTPNNATAWFAVLERARVIGDADLAHKALGELQRLGVEVTFSQRAKTPRAAAGKAAAQ